MEIYLPHNVYAIILLKIFGYFAFSLVVGMDRANCVIQSTVVAEGVHAWCL